MYTELVSFFQNQRADRPHGDLLDALPVSAHERFEHEATPDAGEAAAGGWTLFESAVVR
jgi:hypothetical protein